MWDLIVSVPDHCLSFYVSFFLFPNKAIHVEALDGQFLLLTSSP